MTIGVATLNEHYGDRYFEPVGEAVGSSHAKQSVALRQVWVVLVRLYSTTSVDMDDGPNGHRRIIDVVERKLDPILDKHLPVTPVDVNWALTISNHNESPIVHHGEIFRFRPLGNGPIMLMTKNRHRWDASSTVVATREDLMLSLDRECFTRPWLVFGQTRLFPATPRIPDAAIANVDAVDQYGDLHEQVSDLMHGLLNDDPNLTTVPYEMLDALKKMSRQYRYLSVRIARSSYHRQLIGKLAGFINLVFFETGIVLIRKCDREQDVPANYVGRHGELYHDFKLMVDRLAPFSNGQFSTGWARWLGERAAEAKSKMYAGDKGRTCV